MNTLYRIFLTLLFFVPVLIAQNYEVPEVLYYKFDTGTTTTPNHAVPGSGSASADILGGLTMGPTGQFNSGLIGTGASSSTDYVNTGWIPDLGASNWTISLYLNNLPTGTTLNYLFGGTVAIGWRCFYAGAAGQFGVLMRLTGLGGSDITVPNVGPGPSVLTFVYDSSVPAVYAYINGVLTVTQPQAGALNMTGSDNFKVGAYGTSVGMPAGSIMDEFRFYNRALGAAEISGTWNQMLPVAVPVELTSFTAASNGKNINLNWTTASESNNKGFNIERKTGNGEFETISFVPGFGTTTQAKIYSYSDVNLQSGSYIYRLKQIDFDGSFEYSNEVEAEVTVPADFSLQQNFPNPFNPSTTINWQLAVQSKVTLKIFNSLGEEVETLIDQFQESGDHSVSFIADSKLASGIYFYRIDASGIDGSVYSKVMKMSLMK